MKNLLTAMSIGMIFFQSCNKENLVTPKSASTIQTEDETLLYPNIKPKSHTIPIIVIKETISTEEQDTRQTQGKVSQQTPPIYIPGVISKD